jgi:phosphatidylcholine synthase
LDHFDGRMVRPLLRACADGGGAVACALLALMAAVAGQWAVRCSPGSRLALVVDAADGPLAHQLEFASTLPRWSGDTLDLVVDFTTYVFVPAYAIAASRLLPAGFGAAASASSSLVWSPGRFISPTVP